MIINLPTVTCVPIIIKLPIYIDMNKCIYYVHYCIISFDWTIFKKGEHFTWNVSNLKPYNLLMFRTKHWTLVVRVTRVRTTYYSSITHITRRYEYNIIIIYWSIGRGRMFVTKYHSGEGFIRCQVVHYYYYFGCDNNQLPLVYCVLVCVCL